MSIEIKRKIQSFGGFLTGMVLPNIGAFIAFGLLAALFMPTGWFPNAEIDAIRAPMLRFMLPLLMAYTGGSMVAGTRGGVIGVIGTFGVIASSTVPMFIGAMVMGPLSAYIIKKFDKVIEGRVRSGFEMLVNNFSIGIIGLMIAICGYLAFGPIIVILNDFFRNCVGVLVEKNLLFVLPVFTEPARMLFLNNAISQGIMNPMGIQDAAETGKSIYFLMTSNPGPGLGMLLAYWMFGKGNAKDNAPSASIILLFGGIHEIYFPYVLMKPVLILSTMVGWMCSNLYFNLVHAGLVAYPSPGSLISYLLMCPPGEHIKIIIGLLIGAGVSFIIAAPLLRADKKVYTEDNLASSIELMKELKGSKKETVDKQSQVSSYKNKTVKQIVFACDAGMGSSAMGASLMRNKVKKSGLNIEVINTAIEKIPATADIVICHKSLHERAEKVVPHADFVTITNFINAPEYDVLIEKLIRAQPAEDTVIG